MYHSPVEHCVSLGIDTQGFMVHSTPQALMSGHRLIVIQGSKCPSLPNINHIQRQQKWFKYSFSFFLWMLKQAIYFNWESFRVKKIAKEYICLQLWLWLKCTLQSSYWLKCTLQSSYLKLCVNILNLRQKTLLFFLQLRMAHYQDKKTLSCSSSYQPSQRTQISFHSGLSWCKCNSNLLNFQQNILRHPLGNKNHFQ